LDLPRYTVDMLTLAQWLLTSQLTLAQWLLTSQLLTKTHIKPAECRNSKCIQSLAVVRNISSNCHMISLAWKILEGNVFPTVIYFTIGWKAEVKLLSSSW
jgi:hypothetical protein